MIQQAKHTDKQDREYIEDKEVEVTDIYYSDPLNIKVVRVFLDQWDKIVLRLEERLNEL